MKLRFSVLMMNFGLRTNELVKTWGNSMSTIHTTLYSTLYIVTLTV